MFENVSTFTLILYMIVLLLVVMLLTLIALLIHSGLFRALDDIGTGKPPIGQTVLAYRFQKGPYNEAGQVFTEAAIISPGNKALGIYYDDPHKVDSKELRYVVGSVLSEGSSEINEEEVKKFTEQGFKILHLPEVAYAVRTKFPHVTSLSILIAIFKAYPQLKEYIEEHKLCAYPFVEYYDGESVHFMAPLSKQDEFFVPECEKDGAGDQPTSEFETTLNTSHSTLGEEPMTSDAAQTTLESEGHVTADGGDESLLNTTQNSSVAGDSADKDGDDDDDSEDKDGEESKSALDSGRDRSGTEDSELADDEQTLSDGSTSSFEVLKHDQTEF
ncbi:testis-expressed protein 264 [Aplysia californica]|uniref:Testis-expressed protein 264 n=1 Tax=Aplysia californica TaxID=6500 RepID=A0ABM0JCY8_APLCA|nr:testis-expressed protein 264 [Aplysia californica]